MPHFSEHDLEGTTARVVAVDTTSHEHNEDDLGAQEQAVVQERPVAALPRARPSQSLPLGSRLRLDVSVCASASVTLQRK